MWYTDIHKYIYNLYIYCIYIYIYRYLYIYIYIKTYRHHISEYDLVCALCIDDSQYRITTIYNILRNCWREYNISICQGHKATSFYLQDQTASYWLTLPPQDSFKLPWTSTSIREERIQKGTKYIVSLHQEFKCALVTVNINIYTSQHAQYIYIYIYNIL